MPKKQYDAITQHHLDNLRNGKSVKFPDGGVATVRTIQTEDAFGGVPTLVPTIWDGKVLSDNEAVKRAVKSGVKWPQAKSHPELRQMDIKIHEQFNKDVQDWEKYQALLRAPDQMPADEWRKAREAQLRFER